MRWNCPDGHVKDWLRWPKPPGCPQCGKPLVPAPKLTFADRVKDEAAHPAARQEQAADPNHHQP